MTRRPAIVYALFAACLLLAGLGATWLSWTVVDRDHAEALARREAVLEENVRLALWRLDSEVATLIATENARPYFDYAAFRSLERSYASMVDNLSANEPVQASPLLLARPKYVRLHFQYAPRADVLSSPQVPPELFERRARQLVGEGAIEEAEEQRQRLEKLVKRGTLLAALDEARDQTVEKVPPPAPSSSSYALRSKVKNVGEYWQRTRSVQQASTYNAANNLGVANEMLGERGGLSKALAEHALLPVWIDGELVLARRVQVGQQTYVQGIWLDWPAMNAALRDVVEDLLPSAELEPVRGDTVESLNLLASLPVRLEPGPLPYERIETSLSTLLSLAAVWMGFLLAGAAMVVLVVGAMSLSERRAVFVSAVTHELRTPLTTFRMYTEMLSDGKVKDEKKQRRYLDTLRREAIRLAHLVENVLAYARIERGSATSRVETITTDELLARMLERLEERAAQAKMTIEYAPAESDCAVRADPAAVEQILFNLVDNACKYAAKAEDKRLHVEVRGDARHVFVEVWDHGPGVHGEERRSLFSAFSKSAQRAAMSAPGVGLGLALSQRLAKDMGAQLSYRDHPEGGASFTLRFGVTQSV
ncbi:MAG: HAMP domain-containing sensor histidine kinase [Deltaproteobacteria bacterium]|jgi:signal transduction histidine kinase